MTTQSARRAGGGVVYKRGFRRTTFETQQSALTATIWRTSKDEHDLQQLRMEPVCEWKIVISRNNEIGTTSYRDSKHHNDHEINKFGGFLEQLGSGLTQNNVMNTSNLYV